MHIDSIIIFEVSYLFDVIRKKLFDTIYHEHISFFNINSFNELTKRTGLNLVDVFKTPIHGTSYLFVLSKKLSHSHKIKNLIDLEASGGLYSKETYEKVRLGAKYDVTMKNNS